MLCVSGRYCQPLTTSLGTGTPLTSTESVAGSGLRESGKTRRRVLSAWAMLTSVASNEASQMEPTIPPVLVATELYRKAGSARLPQKISSPGGVQPLGVVPAITEKEIRFSFP